MLFSWNYAKHQVDGALINIREEMAIRAAIKRNLAFKFTSIIVDLFLSLQEIDLLCPIFTALITHKAI